MRLIDMGKLAIGLALLFVVAACRDESGSGAPFEISGKFFNFNYRVATATYLITLKPLEPMREGDVVVGTFENPAGGEPVLVRQKVWPKLDKVTLESEPLRCVIKDKPYAISIEVQDAKGTVRQKIETTLTSNLDQSILPDRPLVVGPAYTPNPELSGRPSGHLPPDQKEACPPAA